MKKLPQLMTERLKLIIPSVNYAEKICQYYQENDEHLSAWEPAKTSAFHKVKTWQERLSVRQDFFHKNQSVQFIILQQQTDEILGVCNFTNFMPLPFSACHLGYSLAAKQQGHGYMLEALQAGIHYIFQQRKLHRIMANYMPNNQKSEKLLQKLGFEKEGYAKNYLKIAGQWQDHILTSLINPTPE